ncbi:hypothetical protein GmHk_18G051451 [Glycine max]|nr:hypothetical protein GmHk_18G051451 [Glycine max]
MKLKEMGGGSCKCEHQGALGKDPSNVHVDTIGLYILMALGKVYDNLSTIHNVLYADDVVRVSVVKVYHSDTEDLQKHQPKPVGSTELHNAVAGVDPLGESVKNLFDLSWDETKFGIPNVKDIFLSHMFMNDWSASLGYGSLYGFLEPQSIHNAKDRHQECQHYIETWGTLTTSCFVSTGQYYCLKPDVNIKVAVNSAMKTLTTTLEGKLDQLVPRWIEPKILRYALDVVHSERRFEE